MNDLLAVAAITILAVISPGGDFAMVTRNSYLYGRRAGIVTACGIAAAVWVHIAYTLLGVSLLLLRFPLLFNGVRFLGAAYLIVIGIRTFRHPAIAVDLSTKTEPSGNDSAFRDGFITNALNPKATLFVLSTFTQVVQPATPLALQIGYGAFMSLAHLVWFCVIASVLARPTVRQALLLRQRVVNRAIGTVLAALGLLLVSAATPSNSPALAWIADTANGFYRTADGLSPTLTGNPFMAATGRLP